MATRDRILRAVVPVMALAVAAFGTWRHLQHDQTSWRGGTLGMFAMVDSPANRLLRGMAVVDSDPDGDLVILTPPASVSSEAGRARIQPTEENLAALGRAWSEVLEGGRLVTVEVWATRFRVEGPSVGLEMLASHDVESS